MSKQIQVAPVVHRLLKFLTLIEEGKFKVPTFQREFVWKDKEKIELFDSISREYPIGSILLWQPKDEYRNKTSIGPYKVDYLEDKRDFYYVLDGFQRLSTLFGCLTNPHKTSLKCNKEQLEKEYSLLYDLEEQTFKMQKYHTKSAPTLIPVYILVDTFALLDFLDELREQVDGKEQAKVYVGRAKKLSSTLIDYQIPSIEIAGGTIQDAIDIFSRANSKGVEISPDWMLSALTSNEEENFNLGNILGELKDNLKEFNFGDIKREILVKCIQSSFGEIHFDQPIEDMAQFPDFKDVSLRTIESIKKTVKFLFEELLIIERKSLPYTDQFVFLTYFFNKVKNPDNEQIQKLKNWFWFTTYSNYFTTSLGNIRKAFEQFSKFVDNASEKAIYHEASQKAQTESLPKSVSYQSVRSTAFRLFLLNQANNFQSIKSNDVEVLKTLYLYKDQRNHSTLFPMIVYTKSSKTDHPFKFEKPKEMAYLFEDENLKTYQDAYFLNEQMVTWHKQGRKDLVQRERLKLIEAKERAFVEQLGITYSRITNNSE